MRFYYVVAVYKRYKQLYIFRKFISYFNQYVYSRLNAGMGINMNKTNVMRMLDADGIEYEALEYLPDDNDLSGVHVADQIGIPREQVFKTLVARGNKTGPVVFVIPCEAELDLKKCAAVSGNKNVELLTVKELLPVTGYIRGGCSPIGMKRKFPVYFDESVTLYDKITVSAGVRGCQLVVDRKKIFDFKKALGFFFW